MREHEGNDHLQKLAALVVLAADTLRVVQAHRSDGDDLAEAHDALLRAARLLQASAAPTVTPARSLM